MCGTKMVFVDVVPEKGKNSYARERVSKNVRMLGHKRLIFKTDQEPAILDLKNQVKALTEDDLVPEESPVGESQNNGEIERSMQQKSR